MQKVYLFPHQRVKFMLILNEPQLNLIKWCLLQIKYKEEGLKSLSQSVYSQLPETMATQFARNVSEAQSDVRAYFFH